jgi:uncharacterized protein YndB with AHSA1/START domain
VSEYGTITEAGSIRFERLLPAPIERVWDYLTDPELRRTWFAGGRMEPEAGGRLTLVFRHSELASDEETPERYRQFEGAEMQGRIIRYEPPRLLVHSWTEDGAGIADSEVTFELAERGEQTLLTLTHRRLPGRAAMVNVAGGWHTHLDLLEDLLSGRRKRPFWSSHAKTETEYEKRIPKEG